MQLTLHKKALSKIMTVKLKVIRLLQNSITLDKILMISL